MGKTFEALQLAEKEANKKSAAPLRNDARLPMHSPPVLTSVNVSLDHNRYDDLRTNLLVRRADAPIKIILFAATSHGAGCSTTAVHFSRAIAKDKNIKVLLIDVNLRTPSLHEVFKVDRSGGVSELLNGDREIGSKIRTVEPGNISVITCGGKHSEPIALLDSERFDRMLELINGRFQYIILDGPPVPACSESILLAGKTDGVVLVLEAGKTRSQVAIRAKKQIEQAGGRIIGVVMNKRKHYIPDWLYRRL